MVYTKLHIVSGLLLTREQIINALKDLAKVDFKGMEEQENSDELADRFNEAFVKPDKQRWTIYDGKYPTLFSFPCCSKSEGKFFILGFKLHTYYRRHVQCKNCKEFSVCDKCIGETSNGWYDIDKIFDEPTRIPREKVCGFCHSDQVEANFRCKCCFRENPEKERALVAGKPVPTGQEERLGRFARETLGLLPETYSVAHYYLIDDCLSCT